MIATAFLYVTEKPANPHNIRGKMGEVLNVYTETGYRRQGIAEHLIKNMLLDAEYDGLSAVKLQATDMGKPMYLKIGFQLENMGYTAMRYDF